MDFEIGQKVTVPAGTALNGSYYDKQGVEAVGTITRFTTHKIYVTNLRPSGGWAGSYWVAKSDITVTDPNAPRARKYGETPEGMISINDPRIDWIWLDVAKYATAQGYCTTFDTMASALGIPGRERNFKVVTKINGLNATINMKARSKDEAEKKVAEQIASAIDIKASED